MNSQSERTPVECFRDAVHQYIEGHQACAWCGGSHRVFKSQYGNRLEYCCCQLRVLRGPRPPGPGTISWSRGSAPRQPAPSPWPELTDQGRTLALPSEIPTIFHTHSGYSGVLR